MLNGNAKKFSELTEQNFVKVVADVNSASKSCPENIFFLWKVIKCMRQIPEGNDTNCK